MTILFLTIAKIDSVNERGIYSDLMRHFRNKGHNVFLICPTERKYNKPSQIILKDGITLIKVWTLNLQKTNLVEKGIGTLLIEPQYLKVIRKKLSGIKFDLVIHSTPPITFSKVVRYVKKRDNAFSYLLLKDIFPQNAVDLKMITERSVVHRFFVKKEKELYCESDMIGCMSEANKEYILNKFKYLNPAKVEVNPNSIEPLSGLKTRTEITLFKERYSIPQSSKVLLYGGNLGAPQGISFLLDTIANCKNPKAFFLIIGAGREYGRIEKWFNEGKPLNAKLIPGLPKSAFDEVAVLCDIGLIFLNPFFTIPNFPSRLLSYLEWSLPVLAATDTSTDIGHVIENAACGKWVVSGDLQAMLDAIDYMLSDEDRLLEWGKNARNLLEREFTVDRSYNLIMEKLVSRDV